MRSLRGEEWRGVPVPGFEGLYQVSNYGRVRALPWRHRRRYYLMRPLCDPYARVWLQRDRRKVRLTIHLAVAQLFLPEQPQGTVVNHIDGNKANPRADNLEYLTHAENIEHAATIRPVKRKLTSEQVEEIRTLSVIGWSCRKLSARFGVSYQHIQHIVSLRRWAIPEAA